MKQKIEFSLTIEETTLLVHLIQREWSEAADERRPLDEIQTLMRLGKCILQALNQAKRKLEVHP